MSAVLAIGWFLWLMASIVLVFYFLGFSGLNNIRAWTLPAQIASLAFFSAAVLCNPWNWP